MSSHQGATLFGDNTPILVASPWRYSHIFTFILGLALFLYIFLISVLALYTIKIAPIGFNEYLCAYITYTAIHTTIIIRIASIFIIIPVSETASYLSL